MSKPQQVIRISSGALDEGVEKNSIVIRGVIHNDDLRFLMTGSYQREAQPLTALSSLMRALDQGEPFPDIELGMRGDGNGVREMENGNFELQDPIYIIDGLQRVNAAMHYIQRKPDAKNVRIGALVHLGTTEPWERDRFRVLNTMRQKVSPNVLLRNHKEESTAVDLLHAISSDDGAFALNRRVSWSQRMAKGELLGAMVMAKVIGMLHAHLAATKRNAIAELVPAMDKLVEIVGANAFRTNVRNFFDLIDECWGIRRVQYREGAVQLRGSFLLVLARFLSDHYEFWRDPNETKLMVEAPLRRKLAQFSTQDPTVQNLASSGGKSREMLYLLIRNHMNSGKRTKRLQSRNGDMVTIEEPEENGG